MKRNWKNRITVLFLLLWFATACNKNKEHAEHADTYTCPMHPTVTSDKPGTCPVCGMDLVMKARYEESAEITEDLAKLIKSPNETVVSSIRTIKPEYKSETVNTAAQGIVTYDTRGLFTIPARVGGRLEKVYLKYAFQHIRKGEKVVDIYSPEMLTAQRELLFLIDNDSQNELLISGAKKRLQLLGASDAQIRALIQQKEPSNTFSIFSPYDGYVISETQQTPVAPVTASAATSNGMSDGMGSSSSSTGIPGNNMATNSSQDIIREGSYVSPGQTLFRIVNTSALRVELNLSLAIGGKIKKGSDVILDFGNGDEQHATVDFIQPFFSEGQEFITIRVYTPNSEKLHIGHLVNARLKSESIEGLWVPNEAVLDLGVDKIIFIKEKNVLKPKKVVTAARTDDAIQIKQGLSSSDEIAANAQYLVDSESFIKTIK